MKYNIWEMISNSLPELKDEYEYFIDMDDDIDHDGYRMIKIIIFKDRELVKWLQTWDYDRDTYGDFEIPKEYLKEMNND